MRFLPRGERDAVQPLQIQKLDPNIKVRQILLYINYIKYYQISGNKYIFNISTYIKDISKYIYLQYIKHISSIYHISDKIYRTRSTSDKHISSIYQILSKYVKISSNNNNISTTNVNIIQNIVNICQNMSKY